MNLQNRENLFCFQFYVVELGNEYRGYILEDGCFIYVYGGFDGKNEFVDFFVYVIVFFNVFYYRRKGC